MTRKSNTGIEQNKKNRKNSRGRNKEEFQSGDKKLQGPDRPAT